MKGFVIILIILSMFSSSNIHSQIAGTWVEKRINAQMVLTADGFFKYIGQDGQFQGKYSIQNNIFLMQDLNGNHYRFDIQVFTENRLVLSDQNGAVYNYERHINTGKTIGNKNYPWQQNKYNKIIATRNNLQWKESQTQIYVNFLELLVGQKITLAEVNKIRQSNLSDFKDSPKLLFADVKDVEASLKKIYLLNRPEAIAMVREELFNIIYLTTKKQPDLKNSVFIKILNSYIQVLKHDASTNLSISNQDVDAYVKYLQFQNMIMGRQYEITKQNRAILQMQIVNNFTTYPLEQKKTLAYAYFLWNVISKQWSKLNVSQQKEYLNGVQNQLNVQNNKGGSQHEAQKFWNNTNKQTEININEIKGKYKKEAATKGMTLKQYLKYKQKNMAVNNQIFNTMQNTMNENNALMLNITNNIGGNGGYYYVDYND